MKQIELKKMDIRNFKGISSLTVDFGKLTNIYGDNATGKTSIYDAFTWLLFNKDSADKADFEIKPLDSAGEVKNHEAQTEVTAELLIDGEPITLAKTYKEVWKTKRGSSVPELANNETGYYVDEVKKKQNEYKAIISEIIDEQQFRLLSSVEAFAKMDWKERRKIILSVCGEPTNEEVLAFNPDLSPIKELINKYSTEDIKKVYTGKKSKINAELKELPARIDTALEIIGNVEPQNIEYQQEIIAERRQQLDELMNERSRIAADTSAVREKEKLDLTAQLRELELQNKEYQAKEYEAYSKKNAESLQKRTELDSTLRSTEITIGQFIDGIAQNTKRIEQMRKDYKAIRAEEWTGDTVCPTCGQAIPEDKIKKSRAIFNISKSERLTQNSAEGQELSAQIKIAEKELETWEKQAEQLRAELKNIPSNPPFIPSDMPEYKATKELLENKLAQLVHAPIEETARAQIDEIDKQLESIKSEINDLNGEIVAETQRADARALIEKYKEREKALSIELEQIESVLYATEQFVRTKVEMIEGKIGKVFKKASFKLFNLQMNGGIQEVCKITYNGVPYDSLNNAARINIGIDIINTLAEHYGVYAPVFVDNAESVVNIEPSDGQQIRLIVSGADKELRIENNNKLNAEVA